MSSSGGERRPSPTMPLFHAQAYHQTTNQPVSLPQTRHQHVGGGSRTVVNQHPRLGPGPPRTRMVTTHPHRPSGAGPPIHHPGAYAAPQAPPTAHVHQGGGRHLYPTPASQPQQPPTQNNNSCGGTATPMVTRHGGQRLAGQQTMLPLSVGSSTVVPAHHHAQQHQQASRKGPNDALPLTNSTSSGVGGGGGGRKQHSHHHMDDASPESFKKVPRSSTKTSQPRQPLPDVLALSSRPPRWTENEVS